jgi:hypothetical protein
VGSVSRSIFQEFCDEVETSSCDVSKCCLPTRHEAISGFFETVPSLEQTRLNRHAAMGELQTGIADVELRHGIVTWPCLLRPDV